MVKKHITTVRDVGPGEELCISYSHKLWFASADVRAANTISVMTEEPADGWGELSPVMVPEPDAADLLARDPYVDGDPDEVFPDEVLPFTRFKLPPEEEELDSIRTGAWTPTPDIHRFMLTQTDHTCVFSAFPVEAWVVDIPDPRHITTMLK